MKIQLMSDLHLDHYSNGRRKIPELSIENGVDVLVLAGDIQVGLEHVSKFLREVARNVDDVIYVSGNHEYYDGTLSVSEFNSKLKEEFIHDSDIHILDCSEYVEIQDVTFFGGTLWTNFRDDPLAQFVASNNISDFSMIKNFSANFAAKEFYRQSEFIKNAYESVNGKKVIVTHFLPAVECIHPRWQGPNNELNKYFANDLGSWIETLEDTTWLFGHTHDMIDINLGSTRLLSNPMGYPGEFQREYKPCILEI